MDAQARAYLRTLVYAAVLGIPVAFAAVLFQTAIHDVEHVVWDVVPEELGWSEPAGWYVLLVPGIAGLLVAATCRLPGHGGHSPLEGLGAEPVQPSHLASILLAGLASLALGVVLGPEAPLIALGLGLGVVASRLMRMEGETEGQLLTLAGAFAAIAALFGGPLVAALLLFEIVAAKGTIPSQNLGRALLPGFVAAGSGALVFTGVEGWPGLHQTSLAIPDLPAYETVQISDLAWCLVLSIAVAILVVGIRHLGHEVAARGSGRAVVLAVSGLLIGALAVVFRAVTDEPVDLVLFSGQTALPDVVAETAAGVLALLVVAKGLAYALSLGAGFRGGPVFPALAIGVAFGVMAANVLPGLDTTPAVAAGIAAATATALRIPFTAVLFVILLTGSSATEVAPIAVLAAAVGWLVAVALPSPEDRAAEKAAARAAAAAEPSGR